ncbi:HugZ family pyridoxamine 5'-phosphate oxidase [Pseudochelatococcus sp. B33]
MPNRIQSIAPDPTPATAPQAPGLSGSDTFDPLFCTRQLLRGLRFGSLATLREDGAPFASLVNVASGLDGTPVTLISRLAVHTQNIARDTRVSLLLAHPVGADSADDPANHPRISLTGRAQVTADPDDRRRFLARHPHAAAYADFADFAFYRLTPEHIHLVAGFGRITGLSPAEVLSEPGVAAQLAPIEAGAVAHMNEDHADALGLYATVLAGAPPGPWRATGLDAEGIDLFDGAHAARVWYPQPLTEAGQLRPALVALAREARERDASGA